MIKKILLGLSVVAFACAGSALAQQAAIKRTPLQKAEFPDGFVSVSAIAEIPPGGAAGRHSPTPAWSSATSWRAKPTLFSMASLPSI